MGAEILNRVPKVILMGKYMLQTYSDTISVIGMAASPEPQFSDKGLVSTLSIQF
jgi:hypothetical protein